MCQSSLRHHLCEITTLSNNAQATSAGPVTRSTPAATPASPSTTLYWNNPTIEEPFVTDQSIIINSVTLHLPASFEGPFLTAASFQVSGVLTLDLSAYPAEFEGTLFLFGSEPEGTFATIQVNGVDPCVTVEFVSAGQLLVQNTCLSSAAEMVRVN